MIIGSSRRSLPSAGCARSRTGSPSRALRSLRALGWASGLALLLTILAAFAPSSPAHRASSWASLVAPSTGSAQCIDEAIRDELNARRRYRGVRERLFQKAGRFELSVFGGVYAADLLSASYLVGGSLTYHVTEDIGLEASFGYSRAESELVRIIEQNRGITLVRIDAPVYIYTAHLIWTLAYGKLRWFGAEIGRFDFNFAIGGGITDNTTSRGLTGSFGFGVKFFFAEWFEIRLDIRDQILEQELLGAQSIVNNLTATLGLAVYLPFEF